MNDNLNHNQVNNQIAPETMFDIDREQNIIQPTLIEQVQAARRPRPPERPVAPGPEPIPPGMRPPIRPVPPGPEPIPPGMRPPIRPIPPGPEPICPPGSVFCPPIRPVPPGPEPICPPRPGAVCPPRLPPNRVYVVRRGDTLRSIARRFGVNVRDIMRVNNLRRPTVRVGQRLVIPPIPIVPL